MNGVCSHKIHSDQICGNVTAEFLTVKQKTTDNFVRDVFMDPWGDLDFTVLHHLKALCAFDFPLCQIYFFVFLCAAWLPLTSAATGIHVHCPISTNGEK